MGVEGLHAVYKSDYSLLLHYRRLSDKSTDPLWDKSPDSLRVSTRLVRVSRTHYRNTILLIVECQ